MVDSSNVESKRSTTAITGDENISSKMEKTHVSPPNRQRRSTIRDDLNFKFVGNEFSKVGTRGKPTELMANMFEVRTKPNCSIHMHAVVFNPEITSFRLKSALINKCNLGGIKYFNNNVLYLTTQIQDQNFTVKMNEGDEVVITITHKSKIQQNSSEMNSMLGGLVKRCIAEMSMVQINRGMYLMETRQNIDGFPMDVVHGYTTSILPHENSCLLTVNLSNKVMATGTVLDEMNRIMRDQRGREQGMQLLQANLIGKTIFTSYNNKTYKIDDIDMEINPTSTFPQRTATGEKEISYIDYFQEHYGKTIKDRSQPMLISRQKKLGMVNKGNDRAPPKNICLVPELCTLCGIPDDLFANFNFKKAMDAKIRKDPSARQRALDDFIKNFEDPKSQAHKNFSDWGFELKHQAVNIKGRTLDHHNLTFGGGQTGRTAQSIQVGRQPMYSADKKIITWYILYPERSDRDAQDFLSNLTQLSRNLGMSVQNPRNMIPYANAQGLSKAMDQIRNGGGKPDMIVMILRNQNKSLYDFFKKKCSCEWGVPSQCLLTKHFMKRNGLASVITKIAIQMQCKLGGAPYAVKIPPKDKFMIVGMDTYHDSSKKGLSCAAVVATMNNEFTKYCWATAMVSNRQEINSITKMQFTKLLQSFHDHNNGPPGMVIIYRDGVGEGQVNSVMEFEFSGIQAAIAEVNPEAKIAFLTISKRIETRFFSRGGNPPGGTIVDTVATHANMKDFYMVPIESRQGTVAPLHYRMHYNTIPLKADHFQQITYMLCFMYFNWNGPVKIPSPVQYAHKLAYLVGTHLHTDPHKNLSKSLFFL